MEEEIITKIKLELKKPIEAERQVVYILIEIGKFLKKTGKKDEFSLLNFYRNWVSHDEIDHTSAVDPLLKEIEQKILNGEDELDSVWSMINFCSFRIEMEKFLVENDCQNPFNEGYWFNFRRFLIKILIDCPLKLSGYKRIGEFRFKKSLREGVFVFILKDKDGKDLYKKSFSFLPDR